MKVLCNTEGGRVWVDGESCDGCDTLDNCVYNWGRTNSTPNCPNNTK